MVNRKMESDVAIRASMADGSIEKESPVFTSKYVYESKGVPNDPKIIATIDKWAEAWGNFTWACKTAGILNTEKDLPNEIKPLADELEDAINKLESALSKTTINFKDYELGKIGWTDENENDCFVMLSV